MSNSKMEEEPSTSENPQFQEKLWVEIQESLRKRLIPADEFKWKLPAVVGGEQDLEREKIQDLVSSGEILQYVGGVDLSFSKKNPSIACATLVVLDLTTYEIVHEDSSIVQLDIPYVSGFLAFREAPVLLELLNNMRKRAFPCYPQLLMVDGNGLLHPRGFGLACHIGVLADLPTTGVGKNLHHVDGITQSKVRHLFESKENSSKDVFSLIGDSGSTLGVAMRSTQGSLKPVFISVGHRICLASAIKVIKLSCRYRVPEPIRQADIRSKVYLRKHGLS